MDSDALFTLGQNLLADQNLNVYGSGLTLAQRRERDEGKEATWTAEDGSVKNLRTFTGHIKPDPERERHVRDTGTSRLFVLREQGMRDEFVGVLQFRGPPSALFTYTVKARVNTFAGQKHFIVVSYTRDARPFDKEILGAILQDYFCVKPSTVGRWANALPHERFEMADLEGLVDTKDYAADYKRLRMQPDLRGFFLNKQLRALETYFGQASSLEWLTWSHVLSMYWQLTNEPFLFCFKRFLRQPQPPPDAKFFVPAIEPLTLKKAKQARNELFAQRVFTPAEIEAANVLEAAIFGYESMLADLEDNKQAYAHEDNVATTIRNHLATLYPGRQPMGLLNRLQSAAVEKLLSTGIVRRVDPKIAPPPMGGLQLNWVHDCEQALCEALKTLASRSGSEVAQCMGELSPEHKACSEQRAAWKRLRDNRLLVVDGIGGSGKSEFVRMVCSSMPEEWFVCTAATSAACANLAPGVGGRAWNMHKLLHTHSATLDSECGGHVSVTPSRDGKPPPLQSSLIPALCYRRCIFEKLRFLVIDEFSLAHPSVLAALLAFIMACAPHLSHILIVQDPRQQAPINWGFMGRDLTSALEKTTYYMRFEHNHRAKGSTAAKLVENNRAIHARQPSYLSYGDAVGSAAKLVPFNMMPYGTPVPYALENASKAVVDIVKRAKMSEYDTLVLTRTNVYRDSYAMALERYYLQCENTYFDPKGQQSTSYVGRKYIFTANFFDYGISNNEHLVLVDIEDVAFPTVQDINARHWFLRVSPNYDMSHVRAELPANVEMPSNSEAPDAPPQVDIVHQRSTSDRLDQARVRFLVFRRLSDHSAYLRALAKREAAAAEAARVRSVPVQETIDEEVCDYVDDNVEETAVTTTTTASIAKGDGEDDGEEDDYDDGDYDDEDGDYGGVEETSAQPTVEREYDFDAEIPFIRIPADPKLTRHIKKAACITVHGAQSAQIPHVVYSVPYYSSHEVRETVYTAFSRAQQTVTVHAQRHVLDKCIQNPEPNRRGTLSHYLRDVASCLAAPSTKKIATTAKPTSSANLVQTVANAAVAQAKETGKSVTATIVRPISTTSFSTLTMTVSGGGGGESTKRRRDDDGGEVVLIEQASPAPKVAKLGAPTVLLPKIPVLPRVAKPHVAVPAPGRTK